MGHSQLAEIHVFHRQVLHAIRKPFDRQKDLFTMRSNSLYHLCFEMQEDISHFTQVLAVRTNKIKKTILSTYSGPEYSLYLIQTQSFGLRKEDPSPYPTQAGDTAVHPKRARATKIVHATQKRLCNDRVHRPIRSRRNTSCKTSDLDRVQLGIDSPRHGTYRSTETRHQAMGKKQ